MLAQFGLRIASSPAPSVCVRMAAGKKAGVELGKFTPTAEELQSARDILAAADAKQKKSKMAAMVAFAKANTAAPDGNDSVLASRGEDRQDYLLKYVAYMGRKKGTISKVITANSHENARSSVTQFHRWSRHEMEREVGMKKASLWIESGKLGDPIPDRITGSTDPDVVEYRVPVSWTSQAENSSDAMHIGGSGEATAEDLANLQSVQLQPEKMPDGAGSSGGSCEAKKAGSGSGQPIDDAVAGGAADAQIKKEGVANPADEGKAKEKEKEKTKVRVFLADPIPCKERLQSMEIEVDKIYPISKKNPLLENYSGALLKHADHVKKVLKGLGRYITGADKANETKMPALLRVIDK